MLNTILLVVFILMLGTGVYYQVKRDKQTKILHVLQFENENKRSDLLDMNIEEQELRLRVLNEKYNESEKE
ncbi:MAG: hypothetical protein HRT41_02160 [Campylobacteraceae bacterium]|nr:hypothetical protein [Campylobacteraceae bacterium]